MTNSNDIAKINTLLAPVAAIIELAWNYSDGGTIEHRRNLLISMEPIIENIELACSLTENMGDELAFKVLYLKSLLQGMSELSRTAILNEDPSDGLDVEGLISLARYLIEGIQESIPSIAAASEMKAAA